MNERGWLADRFEEHLTRLRAVAYRMLGSLSEADDAVQEAWLPLSRSDAEELENLGAWLPAVGAPRALGRRGDREPRGLADAGGRPRVVEHAALTRDAWRGGARRGAPARTDH